MTEKKKKKIIPAKKGEELPLPKTRAQKIETELNRRLGVADKRARGQAIDRYNERKGKS